MALRVASSRAMENPNECVLLLRISCSVSKNALHLCFFEFSSKSRLL